jgi:hypothetical protein
MTVRTSDEIAAVYGAEAEIEALFDRLKSVRSRLAETLWDVDSEDLRSCVIELDAVIREQGGLQRAIRCEQSSALRRVDTEILSETVN